MLIILGVSLLIPDFREYIINLFIRSINALLESADLPSYLSEESDWSFYLATALIVSGFIVFVVGWRSDQKKREDQEKQSAQPTFLIEQEPSWIALVEGNENDYDPLISTSIHLIILTGSKSVNLNKIVFHRYVDGCFTWPVRPKLVRKATNETIEFDGNWKSLQEPYSIPADSQVKLHLSRNFRGPTMLYSFHELEVGDLDITLEYNVDNSAEQFKKNFILHQTLGSLTETGTLKKPLY